MNLKTTLDPRFVDWVNNDNTYSWRQFLKRELLRQRDYKSDLSGKPLYNGCDMHEGILTRANVPKSIWWHHYLYHPFNCFLLLREEHIPRPPTREQCLQIAYERYGRDVVREWYYSLPFKVFPFKLL